MSNVSFCYFTAEPSVTKRLLADWKNTQTKVAAAEQVLIDHFGTSLLWERGRTVLGIAKRIAENEKPRDIEGTSVNIHNVDAPDGNPALYAVYTPNKRYSAGKWFDGCLKEINKCRHEAPYFDRYVAKLLNCYNEAISDENGRSLLHRTRVGISKEKLVIAVPYNKQDGKIPETPAECTQIKHSEFIALTEE